MEEEVKAFQPKVSVIIPIYNVEKYIERCARSLFEQTLDNIEYLFIDDCTPDNSVSILEGVLNNYPQRKPQVVIHRMDKNSGQAAVRKWGIQNATGEYVTHCDSDDWVDHDMFRAMYEKGKTEDADVVVCDHAISNGTEIVDLLKGGSDGIVRNEYIAGVLLQYYSWSLWNKLFKKTLLDDGIRYPQGNMGEDMSIVLQLLNRCERIAYIPKAYYYYFQNRDSITNNLSEDKAFANYTAMKSNANDVMQVLYNVDDSRIKQGIVSLKYSVISHLYPIINANNHYRQIFFDTYPGIGKPLLFSRMIQKKYKIKYLLTILRLYPFKGK